MHGGPALTRSVVGVVGEGTICRDDLGRYAPAREVCRLGYAGELGLFGHHRLLKGCAAVRFRVIECPKAAEFSLKIPVRRFFFCLVRP